MSTKTTNTETKSNKETPTVQDLCVALSGTRLTEVLPSVEALVSDAIANRTVYQQKSKFLIFVLVLMKYLERKDPRLHVQVKRIFKDCGEKKRQKVKGYESRTKSLYGQLKKVVPDSIWKRAEFYTNHYLKERAKKQAGSQSA